MARPPLSLVKLFLAVCYVYVSQVTCVAYPYVFVEFACLCFIYTKNHLESFDVCGDKWDSCTYGDGDRMHCMSAVDLPEYVGSLIELLFFSLYCITHFSLVRDAVYVK